MVHWISINNCNTYTVYLAVLSSSNPITHIPTAYLRQFLSSAPSRQSGTRSHLYAPGMQAPFVQVNCELEHVLPAASKDQRHMIIIWVRWVVLIFTKVACSPYNTCTLCLLFFRLLPAHLRYRVSPTWWKLHPRTLLGVNGALSSDGQS